MAAKTTVKVSITNNAAKNDLFNEDMYSWLSENGGLVGNLAVLANDPGSAHLLGVSDVLPTTAAELTNGVDYVSVTVPDGTFQIKLTANADGTVNFDASQLTDHLDYLAEGETKTVTFYYTAQMANGAYSTARVDVVFAGDNDAPVIVAGATDAVGAVTEDAASPDLTDTGVVAFDDADISDLHSASVVASAGNTLGGTLTLGSVVEDGAGGVGNGTVGWAYNVANANTQYLGAGVTATETFNVTISDGHGGSVTQAVTVTVTGVNDAATITVNGVPDTSVTEDAAGNNTAGGDLDVSDVDAGEAVFQSPASLAGTYGTFAFDADTGTWGYTLNNGDTDTQALGAGVTGTESLVVKSLDGTASTTISVTVTGVNDGPDAVNDTALVDEDATT